LILLTFATGGQTERKTVWTGVYNSAQASRGAAEYEKNCIGCHRGNEQNVNPESRLRGDQFMQRWREDTVESLFSLVKATMPRRDPGSLSENVYLDIITYLLQENGFPAGKEELSIDALKDVRIEGKDGPKPLPHGALAQLVGCLTQGQDTWMLVRGSEPARARSPNPATAEELRAAETQPTGTLQFRLQSLEFVDASFRPLAHTGHKVHVKGFLVLQTGRERINVTSVHHVSETCR
jgi:hypothetical protein